MNRSRLKVYVILISTMCLACNTNKQIENDTQNSGVTDIVNYTESEYDSMREYFTKDSLFQAALATKFTAGDTNLLKIKNLLSTPYSLRNTVEKNDSVIGAMIYAYSAQRNLLKRFDDINANLERTLGDSMEMEEKKAEAMRVLSKMKEELKKN
ncbi:hypothetical protein SAMN05660236_2429 [Ohtaekwangia koreensis]|uniref:DUF4296 domain-containing protein n=2 Tax=Ohtaekwangia koreensis TaxID=688867 RepID=A0A1T5KPB7_9BACT|nr:hypothetical protein SAMN05660236_2429 [Ohtaekwangia koreensis]